MMTEWDSCKIWLGSRRLKIGIWIQRLQRRVLKIPRG